MLTVVTFGVTKQQLRLQHQMLNGHVQLIQQPLTGELVGQFKVTPVRSKLQRLTRSIKQRFYQEQFLNWKMQIIKLLRQT